MLSIILTLTPGKIAEGIVLAASKDSLRIAFPGSEDTLDLSRVEGQWFTADNAPVEIEAVLADGETDVAQFTGCLPRTLSAGRA